MTSRLIVMPNWLGDTVMALPVVSAIRRAHPADRLAALAPGGPASILRAAPQVDAVLVHESLLRDAARLRRERFDEALLLPNSFRSAMAPFLARVPARIGYGTDRRGALLTDAVPEPRRTKHQLADYDALLASRGIEPDRSLPRLDIPAPAAERAASALASAGIEGGKPLVLLAPASASWPTKRWPAERFGRLAGELGERGFACAIAIGPGERDTAGRVASASGLPLPILGEDLDPLELAALLSAARVVVANDSGPMHLASAAGVAVVALFGPTDPGRTGPASPNARVLDRYVFCSPCFLERCPYGHECMKEITVEDVLDAVSDLVDPSGKRA